ncbi:---NA---, partial [Olea europaea subsp. europaea]
MQAPIVYFPIQECKGRRFFENKQDEKNRKAHEATNFLCFFQFFAFF